MNRYICFLGTVLCCVGLPLGSATDLYVSPKGNDANPGSLAQPLASLEAARDAARALRQAGKLPTGGITIWLRGGDYPRSATLELSSADSGTAESPLVWRAYQDEPVRLLGGRELTEWKPVTDPAVVQRLDETARGAVREVDLRRLESPNTVSSPRGDSVVLRCRHIANCSSTVGR